MHINTIGASNNKTIQRLIWWKMKKPAAVGSVAYEMSTGLRRQASNQVVTSPTFQGPIQKTQQMPKSLFYEVPFIQNEAFSL